ncbi:MAG: urea carboxylase-associated family protein [Actinomycetales bacterium]|nr:urea carboxylase-associated family protein [Actinomycetales bacterium]
MLRLAPQTGVGVELAKGARVAIIDPLGGQVSDLFCASAEDPREVLSSGRSIDYANRLTFGLGDLLWSNRSRPMLRIVEDTCGRHDFLLTPCSQETFDILYPDFGGAPHRSCLANLIEALGPFNVEADQIGTTFNVFMNTWWDPDGELHIDPPTSVAGARFAVEAQMDLVLGITACSAEKSNGGSCKPIDYEVLQ